MDMKREKQLSTGYPMNADIQHPALDLFRELLSVPAPPGCEEAMARLIGRKLEALGYAHETDPAGNLLVRLAPRRARRAPPVVLASHMDEIGLVVTGIQPDGRLSVDASGGLLPYKIGERLMTVLGDGAPVSGVLSVGVSGHAGESDKPIPWSACSITTGLTPAALAHAGIRPGSSAVPAVEGRGPVLLGDPADPLVAGWTFDDRMGCVALLRLLDTLRRRRIEPRRPFLVAFTVHEEGGCHGAKVLTHREQPEVFVAVDGCPVTPDTPLALDGRPGVWSKDRLGHYDQRLVRDLCRLACEAGTELQPAVYSKASSDASAVYAAGGAPRVAFVGHVRENSHGFEIARLSVFDNVLKTLTAFVQQWSG